MKRIEVPYIDQTPKYPTGCESISAVMLLRYLGVPITPEAFIDRCLTKRELENRDGTLYGPHPDDAFIGSPYRADAYGCYAPCIASAIEKASDRLSAEVLRGRPLTGLLPYLDQDLPVILWATIDMEPSSPGTAWRLLSREGTFRWTSHEHCLLLIGYDGNTCYFNDPWKGRGVAGYDRTLVETRYREMGAQAVLVTERGKNGAE